MGFLTPAQLTVASEYPTTRPANPDRLTLPGPAGNRVYPYAQTSGAGMPTLNYAAPSTADEAVKLLAGASGLAKVLSGGTDL